MFNSVIYLSIFRLSFFSSWRRKHSRIDNWPEAGLGLVEKIHCKRASQRSWHKKDSAWACLQKRQSILKKTGLVRFILCFYSMSREKTGIRSRWRTWDLRDRLRGVEICHSCRSLGPNRGHFPRDGRLGSGKVRTGNERATHSKLKYKVKLISRNCISSRS